ncbi:hypothetical protein CHS0354_022177 [Potamilus streckersoni]|uniref:DZIP3-like HEPN domain-containing protein n=1 Tax=Potamilus streckersoni TaxID=2493646 RepID=A0AAE0RT86_9BIVA|nr:hypothetical protein CHS0354_022177 [Potamilus streckersoni]
MSATNVDTERFCRLVCLMMQTGTKVLRKLFILHVEGQRCSVETFFAKHKMKISSMKLFPDQRSLIFPPDKSDPDLQKYDITLLALLLNNLFNSVSPNEKHLIYRLKESRKSLNGHKGNAMTDSNEFDRLWKEISNIIINLAEMSNDRNFEDEIKKEIDSFLNDPLGLQETVNVIMERFRRDAKLDFDISMILENQTEMMRMLKRIEQDGKFCSSEEDEVDGTVPEVDKKLPVTKNLNDHTKVRVQSALKDNLVWTRQIQEAEHVINKNGVVTITGNPGEGKTSAGYLLLNKVTSSNLERCIILHDPKDWSFVDMGNVDVLFLDDTFGKHQLDEGLLTKWHIVLSDLQSYVTEGKVKLIVALRQTVLAEFNSRRSSTFSWLPLLTNKVELSSRHLNHDEKRDILITALNKFKRDRDELDIEKCIRLFESPVGFPYCCSLFAADERFFARREDFFLRPYGGIRDILNNMDQCKSTMLAYIFCSSDVHADDLKYELTPSSKSLLQQLCETFLYDKQILSRRKMHDVLKELDGVYIVQDKGIYRFAHNVLYESVGLELSERCPKLLLEKCNIDFLCQCVQTGIEQTDEIFVVTDRLYKDLCMRFIAEVTEKNNASRISIHHALRQPEIRRELILILKETGKVVQFLRGGGNDPTTSIIAYIAIRNVDLNNFVKSLLDSLNSFWYWFSSWKYPLIKAGLWLAYAAGNRYLVDVLLHYGTKIDISCLYASIFSRELVLVESVLEDLKEKKRLDSHSISLSAEVACVIGCSDIFQVILKMKPKLNPHHMIAATFGGNDDMIQIVTDQLHSNEGWDHLGIQFLESCGYLLKMACEGHDPVIKSVDNFLKYQRLEAFTRYTEIFSMTECMCSMALENSDVRTFIDYAEIMQKTRWLKVLLEHSDFVYSSVPSLVLTLSVSNIKYLVCFLKCMKQWNPNGDPVMLASERVIKSGKEEIFQFLVDSGMAVNNRHYLLARMTGREEIIRCVTRNLPSTEV